MPPAETHFLDYLATRVDATFYLNPVTEQKVLKLLQDLNPAKSGGPDNLTPKLLKHIAHVIYIPLTILFNKSIEKAKYPDGWKLAKVTALYKKRFKKHPGQL